MESQGSGRAWLGLLQRFEWTIVGRKTCVFIVNTALLLAGLFNLALGCYEALQGHQTLAVTCLVAGLLLLLAASIDRFEVLKGFGLEAKTRELNKVLTEADVTLDAACRHLKAIEASILAPSPRHIDVKAIVGAEVYSESGEALLRKIADFFAQSCDLGLSRLRVTEVEFDPRW